MLALGPRLVIAGTASGVGKTTVATGLMAALATRGIKVAPAKVGPDFIDPGYHALATGRPGRNLDAWICGSEAIAPLAARAATGCDLLVVEGVMGLFDGSGDPEGPVASTAEVARLLGAPVVLVVDAASMSGSVAALVAGFAGFDPSVRVTGVILNRVASDNHESMLREALAATGTAVLGCLRRDPALTWRDRHLGLVPVAEQPGEVRRSIDRLAAVVAAGCDLEALVALAGSAPSRSVPDLTVAPVDPEPIGTRSHTVPVAVAGGRAFSFYYRDNLEALEQAGAELLPFDPAEDRSLPVGALALYLGGGFPEVYADALAANRPLCEDLGERVGQGLATWAECGGLLLLAQSLDGHPLAGAVPARASMTNRLTLGYRRARPTVDTPLAPAGAELRGHEFHYSTIDPTGALLRWRGRASTGTAGFGGPRLFASYLHLHLGADPSPAGRFVRSASLTGRRATL